MYFKTFENFISLKINESKDLYKIPASPRRVIKILNKIGFEITNDDIMDWDGGNEIDSSGSLTVTINGAQRYFTIKKNILYYQPDTEEVLLGDLTNKNYIENSIKDYFKDELKAIELSKKAESEKNKKDNDSEDDELTDLGL